jgi:hypothetical protein
VYDNFNLDFQVIHDMNRDNTYDWLPSKEDIPKELGQSTDQEHLKSLELSETMKKLYEHFQRYSVGLEQLLLDLSIYGGEHLDKLKLMEDLIRSVSRNIR